MGVLYSVFPFDKEVQNWLQEENFFIPDSPNLGRHPTAEEIKFVCESLKGYKTEFNEAQVGGTWQAFIQSDSDPEAEWTLINMMDYVDEQTPTSIYFEKGWVELIAKVLADLSITCGTLVLMPDTGDPPFVITPDVELKQALSKWYKDCELSWNKD
jgi:hypothetical protein